MAAQTGCASAEIPRKPQKIRPGIFFNDIIGIHRLKYLQY
jgi:hypothetical protein